MLILTRRRKQTLVIGDSVTITVLRIRGSQVRLGVNAPRDIGVHREEIFDRATTGKRRVSDSGGS